MRGYRNAIYSGFPTQALARVMGDVIAQPRRSCTASLQVASEPISKHELLGMIRDAMGLDIEIEPFDDPPVRPQPGRAARFVAAHRLPDPSVGRDGRASWPPTRRRTTSGGDAMLPLEGKRVLITGGTGSLGQVLVRRLLTGEMGQPRKIIVFSRDEAKQHAMRVEYLHKRAVDRRGHLPQLPGAARVPHRRRARLPQRRRRAARRRRRVQRRRAQAGADLRVLPVRGGEDQHRRPGEHRARHPGARTAGRDRGRHLDRQGLQAGQRHGHDQGDPGAGVHPGQHALPRDTRFICVRYGNVLASRGSVIPLFHEQIRSGGPVTITTADMTRFLLSLDQAVDTIFAGVRGGGRGETYIPRVPSARVVDIAAALIGERPIETVVTGIRPGEKVHEILVSEEECHRTVDRGDYYAILPMLPELRDGGAVERRARPTSTARRSGVMGGDAAAGGAAPSTGCCIEDVLPSSGEMLR